jgi:hypothetical protein
LKHLDFIPVFYQGFHRLMLAVEEAQDVCSQATLVIDQVVAKGGVPAEGVLEGVAERASFDGDPGGPHGFMEDARQDERRAGHVTPPSR